MINRYNFTRESLDVFSRYQVVKNVYRVKEGEMYLAYRPFVEIWTLERKREKAAEILAGDHIVYGAFEKNGDIVGILLLLPVLEHDRMILDSFHVSTHKRRQGIGRALFAAAKEEAIQCGAKVLYVSACSARETIDYTAMGFTLSPHPIRCCVEAEPYDIQMECTL